MSATPPVCSPADPAPRRPSWTPPPGAVDAHTHIFESRYPLVEDRSYTPPDAPLEQMLAMHDTLGIERVVFTQPSIYGPDSSAILDAMARIPDRARCIIAADPDVTETTLADLDAKGVRGVRINLDNPGGSTIPLSGIPHFAHRIAEVGWHLEFLFMAEDLPELAPMLRDLPIQKSIAHFGYMPAAEGVEYPPFQLLLDLVRDGDTWVKLSSPYRLRVSDMPPWPEAVPLAHALIEAAPDRMLWATDWPHPFKFAGVPNDADLLEQLVLWAPDETTRNRILVDNPARLYRF